MQALGFGLQAFAFFRVQAHVKVFGKTAPPAREVTGQLQVQVGEARVIRHQAIGEVAVVEVGAAQCMGGAGVAGFEGGVQVAGGVAAPGVKVRVLEDAAFIAELVAQLKVEQRRRRVAGRGGGAQQGQRADRLDRRRVAAGLFLGDAQQGGFGGLVGFFQLALGFEPQFARTVAALGLPALQETTAQAFDHQLAAGFGMAARGEPFEFGQALGQGQGFGGQRLAGQGLAAGRGWRRVGFRGQRRRVRGCGGCRGERLRAVGAQAVGAKPPGAGHHQRQHDNQERQSTLHGVASLTGTLQFAPCARIKG